MIFGYFAQDDGFSFLVGFGGSCGKTQGPFALLRMTEFSLFLDFWWLTQIIPTEGRPL
jgi:hypothetical protein